MADNNISIGRFDQFSETVNSFKKTKALTEVKLEILDEFKLFKFSFVVIDGSFK